MLKVQMEDDGYGVLYAVANGVPEQIDYVYANWTEYQIARHYGTLVYKDAAKVNARKR